MAKKKLLSSAPWRDEEKQESFEDAKLRATNQPGQTPTMYVPRKRSVASKKNQEENEPEIDPELRYSFQRNFQFLRRVFTIDTVVKPLPPAMAYHVSRNLSFFTRIFTQFFAPSSHSRADEKGIADAQKSLGLGQEEKARRVR